MTRLPTAGARSRRKAAAPPPNRHPAFDRSGQFRQRRLAMVQTAVHLFNRSGFHATSVEDIAHELGLSKASLYHYFTDKNELLYECYLYAIESGRVAAERAGESGRTGLEKLEAYIRIQFETLAGAEGAAWVLSDTSALQPHQNREVKKRSRVVDAMLQQFLREGVEDGSIAGVDPKITEFFLIGALNWLPRWYKPEGPRSSGELAEIFLKVAFDGLRPRR
jgi:AcrR family transcriptional regulator